jgi:flagellar motor switch protein FliN/FliY
MNAAVVPTSDVALDVLVQLSVEVGRKQMPIREFLKLAPGSIVELNRPAGDALDVHVNNRLIAHGEIVMVNEHYGIRFTDAVGVSTTRR